MEFRRRFFLDPLLEGLDLNGAVVADLAAGSGYTTIELIRRFPRATVTGFDISEQACDAYMRRTGRHAFHLDLTAGEPPSAAYDVAIVIGGLHHCVRQVHDALATVAGMLRPGGLFLMAEPSADCWLEPLRRQWYQRDHFFEASTEAALSHQLLLDNTPTFKCELVHYLGGPAYFLIYNSLVFRLPRRLKATVAAPMFVAESMFNRLPGRALFPYFVARWRRV